MGRLLLVLGLTILPLTVNAKVTLYDFCVEGFTESMEDNEEAKKSIPDICKCFDSNFKEKIGKADLKSKDEWIVYFEELKNNPSKSEELQKFAMYCTMQSILVRGIVENSQTTYTNNRYKVEEDITRIVQEVRGIYAFRTDVYTKVPSGSETDDLLLTTGFRKTFDRHPFGGVYYVTPAEYTYSDGYKHYFNVNITGLDRSDCLYFCAANWEGIHEDCDTSTACKYDTNNTLTLSFE